MRHPPDHGRRMLLCLCMLAVSVGTSQPTCSAPTSRIDPTRSDLWCRHTILAYAHPSRGPGTWTAEDFKWLAAYRDREGKCQDSLFDGFLILGFSCKDGRHLLSLSRRKPALKSDWEDAITVYLDAATKLSEAFEDVTRSLGKPAQGKVIIALPYPDPRNGRFGPIGAVTLDLSQQGHRITALRWYVDETLRRWSDLSVQGRLKGVRLVGFYWSQEGLGAHRVPGGVCSDADLVREVASYVHEKGCLLHWIPCFGGASVFERRPWRQLGLDCVTQQINYQNPQKPGRPLTIFDEQSADVATYRMHGVEMTPVSRKTNLNPRVWSWHQVFLANLEAALRLNWSSYEAITYYNGNSLCTIAADPQTHVFYEQLHRWTKGQLTWENVEELSAVVVEELKSKGALSGERVKEIAEAKTVLEKLHLMERPAELRAALHVKETAPKNPIGEAWLAVAADDPEYGDVRSHRPGVCFLGNAEWAQAAMHRGKVARFGGKYPGWGGPNFLVNDPPNCDLEIRLTYWAEHVGTVNVYDGKKYHRVAKLTQKAQWSAVTGPVPKRLFATPAADRREPGRNILFDVASKGVYVHKIEVRALPSPQEPQSERTRP